MLLLHRAPRAGATPPGVLLLFGIGLIGRPIRDALEAQGGWVEERLPFTWTPGAPQRKDADRIVRRVEELLGAGGGAGAPATVAVLWSAGVCGFEATIAEAEVEAEGFRSVLRIAEKISRDAARCRVSFRLASSVGGLFEGRHRVEAGTQPLPCRPYGELKLLQENLLRERGAGWEVGIFRLSSVYGPVRPGCRRGLLPSLLVNGLLGRSTPIVGAWTTLRDYVYAGDVGSYLAHRVSEPRRGGEARTLVLASGSGTSLHEVHRVAEHVLGRPIPVHFLRDAWNASDITVAPELLPADWRAVDLETGARAILQDLQSGGAGGAAVGGEGA